MKNLIEAAKVKFNSHKIIILSVLVVTISFLLYAKTMNFELTDLDDNNFVHVYSSHYAPTSAFFDAFKHNVLFDGPTPYYRPILSTSFIIGYKIAKQSESFAHFGNILLHSISVLLMFLFLKKYLFKPKIAFLATLLFAVHPIMMYAAAWIPGRNGSLVFINFILAFAFFIEYLDKKKIYLLIAHILFVVLSCFTKESAISFPFIFFFYYLLTKNKEQKLSPITYPLWILAILVFLYARSSVMGGGGLSLSMLNMSKDNLALPFDYYSAALFFRTPLAANATIQIRIMGSIAMVITGFLAFFGKQDLAFKKRLFYFVLPFLFLAPNFVGERLWFQGDRMYFSMFAITVIFFSFLSQFIENEKRNTRVLTVFLISSLLLVSSVITFVRMDVFKNSLSFWSEIIKGSKVANITAHKFHSHALMKNGRFQEAVNEMLPICEYLRFSYDETNYALSLALLLNEDYTNAAKLLDLMIANKQMLISQIYASAIIANQNINNTKAVNFYLNEFSKLVNAPPEAVKRYTNEYNNYLNLQRNKKYIS